VRASRPVRLLANEPGLRRAVTHSLVAAPPLENGSLAPRPLGPGEDADCHRFDLSGPPGRRLTAEHVVAAWEAGLRVPHGPHGWLLQPVSGALDVVAGANGHAAGLRGEPDALVVCTERPTPDWSARLEHPALWPVVRDSATGRDRGGGDFRWSEDGTALLRVTREIDRPGRVDRIEIVTDAAGDAAALFAAGGIDLAVLYGRAAAGVRTASGGSVRAERLPAWDKLYALWLDPDVRWVNDPSFRRWIATAIDRESMAPYLFGAQGQAAHELSGTGGAQVAPVPRRPFSSTSSPRLTLAYARDDPHAASIAARVKAVLEREGLRVRIEPRDPRALPPDGITHATLVAHQPPVSDPLLALLDTLWPLRETAAEEVRRLLRATRVVDTAGRRESAAEVEAILIESARLVPLVRLHAWLALRPGLDGVGSGGIGVLRLDRAEWVP
jgi:hypothetical protein